MLIAHEQKLVEGRLLGRYQRFIAKVRLEDGQTVGAHCVNPGAMEGLVREGARVWLLPARRQGRKLPFTWELVEHEGSIVGANTQRPNDLVEKLLRARVLRDFSSWNELERERSYGNGSRVDFWLKDRRGEHFLEVKNCHLVYPDKRAYFPDSKTARGKKHLEELGSVREAGNRATVLFVIQHQAAKSFRPSTSHDPEFAAACIEARKQGVKMQAILMRPSIGGYELSERVPVDLRPYSNARHLSWRESNRPHSGWQRCSPGL